MCFVPFYIDGTERTGGAKVLALATSDTLFIVYNWNHQYVIAIHPIAVGIIPLLVIWVLLDAFVNGHHLDSLCRAMASTTATLLFVCNGQTVLLYPHGMADLYRRFFLLRDGTDGSSRTNVGTTCAFWAAIAFVILHLGLQKVLHVGGWTQHSVGTVGNAELTSGAMLLQIGSRE